MGEENKQHRLDVQGRRFGSLFERVESIDSCFCLHSVIARIRSEMSITSPHTIHSSNLRTFTADTASQLDILRHDGNTLGVNGTQVGILKKTNEVSLSGFLEGKNGRSLEAKIGLEVLGDLTDQTLEGQLADQQVGGLLVTADLTKSDGTRAVTVGLLDTSGSGGGLTSSLGGKLLTGSLSSGGLAGGLLGAGHGDCLLE